MPTPTPTSSLPVPAGLPRSWGATHAERSEAWPCEGLLPEADEAYVRAVAVEAPAAIAFRWLCQLRVAPYSYDALDNAFRRSPRRLTPGLDRLEVGQRFMQIFELLGFTPGRDLTLRIHEARARALFGDVALTYATVPTSADRCRLACKLLVRYPRGPARLMRLVLRHRLLAPALAHPIEAGPEVFDERLHRRRVLAEGLRRAAAWYAANRDMAISLELGDRA